MLLQAGEDARLHGEDDRDDPLSAACDGASVLAAQLLDQLRKLGAQLGAHAAVRGVLNAQACQLPTACSSRKDLC